MAAGWVVCDRPRGAWWQLLALRASMPSIVRPAGPKAMPQFLVQRLLSKHDIAAIQAEGSHLWRHIRCLGKYPPPTCAVEVHHTVKEARSALALSETPSHAWCGHAPPLKSVPTGGLARTSGDDRTCGRHGGAFKRRDETK